MGKRRPSFDPAQLGFSFEPPPPPRGLAALAGLDRQVASAVGLALKDDARSREEVAGAMSALLGEEVSRWMLDGYSSEAREAVNISFHRFLALVAVTNRHDLLDAMLRRIGAIALEGEEILLARAGDIDARMRALKAEQKAVQARMKPIGRAR